jgi:hypothetical protein
VATATVASRVDVASLERTVRIDGPDQVIVPGEVRFSVIEPLDDDARAEMDVGIGIARRGGPVPVCTLATADDEEIPTQRPSSETTLLDDPDGRFEVVSVAELPPGDYVARCTVAGEPTQRTDAEMTVGRTFGFADVGEFFGPIVWFLAGVGVAGLMFLVGVILLIVGLVRGSRSGNEPPGPTLVPQPPVPLPPPFPPPPPVPPSSPGPPSAGWTVPEPKSDRPTWRPPPVPPG